MLLYVNRYLYVTADLVQNDDRILNSIGNTDKQLNSLLDNTIQVSRNSLEDDRISQLNLTLDSLTQFPIKAGSRDHDNIIVGCYYTLSVSAEPFIKTTAL
jgi:hypothetical protein